MERRTSKQILKTAKHVIRDMADHVRSSESLPGVRDLVQCFLTGDQTRDPTELIYRATAAGVDHQHLLASARDSAIVRLWSRAKVVYAMDDLLLGYLSESSASAIPTRILDTLPHPNPFLLLPQPDFTNEQTIYYRSHIGVPCGAFIFGRYNHARQMCSTADDKREDLGVMFVGYLDKPTGPMLQTLRCTIPLGAPTLTVDDAVNATIAKFNFTDDLDETDVTRLQAWLRTYVAQVVNSLLYVCTDQPDTQVHHPGRQRSTNAAKRRRKRRPRLDDVDTVITLGFRMGPALHEARQQWEHAQQYAQPGDASRRTRPHQKRGHYRTYWTGRGRTVPTVKWIAPFWVNEDLLTAPDEPRQVVVRPVRKRS